MKPTITGLEEFGLAPHDLRRLGETRLRVHLHLKTYDITRSVVARAPRDRHEFLRLRLEGWRRRLVSRFPRVRFKSARTEPLATSLLARISANALLPLITQPGVSGVHVSSVTGYRRSRPREQHEWFCVRGRVCVQVENQVRGMETIEDRFVLVRADSFSDAERRLKAHWRTYAQPYLNREGLLVRWHLEEVTDVYMTSESELDPNGAEVYSKLYERRASATRTWRPAHK